MKSSDELFQLIHSLSPAEKGYFKKYTSRHIVGEKNGYMQIFECIVRQKHYDEAEVREAFAHARTPAQFPVVKRYLYTLILKSMRAFHAESNTRYRLRGMINDSAFLIEKRLYSQGEKILARAKKLAHEYELFPQVLEIISMEISIWKRKLVSSGKQTVTDLYAERQQVLSVLQNQCDYSELAQKMFRSVRTHSLQEGDEAAVLIAAHPLLTDESRALSRRSAIVMHYVNSMYYYRQRNISQSYYHSHHLLRMLEASPLGDDTRDYYISALNNHLMLCMEMQQDEEFLTTLQSLRQLPVATREEEANLFYSTYANEVYFYLRQGRYGAIINMRTVLEEGMDRFSTQEDKEYQCSVLNGLAVACVAVRKYRLALEYINRTLSIPDNVRKEFHYAVRLLQLVVHFELKDYEYLNHLVRSAYRYFYRQQALHGIAKVFLEFFRNFSRLHEQQQVHIAFQTLHKELLVIAENPFEKGVLALFDVTCWLESAIEGCSMEEIMQKRTMSVV